MQAPALLQVKPVLLWRSGCNSRAGFHPREEPMKKALFCFAVLLLAIVPAVANDVQLIVNGDFESGSLSPWFNDRNFCNSTCVPWDVTTTNPHSGMFSAMDTGNIE